MKIQIIAGLNNLYIEESEKSERSHLQQNSSRNNLLVIVGDSKSNIDNWNNIQIENQSTIRPPSMRPSEDEDTNRESV